MQGPTARMIFTHPGRDALCELNLYSYRMKKGGKRRHGDYKMFVHFQGCSCRCPCCVVAAFITEVAHEPTINSAIMLSTVWYTQEGTKCNRNHDIQFSLGTTLSPRRCATADCLCQHIQPATDTSHQRCYALREAESHKCYARVPIEAHCPCYPVHRYKANHAEAAATDRAPPSSKTSAD